MPEWNIAKNIFGVDKPMTVTLKNHAMKCMVIVLFTIVMSCNSLSQNYKTITVEALKDSCYYLKDTETGKPLEAYRQIVILENTMEDTVALGFGIVYPGYVGKFKYVRMDERTDAMLDPETSEKHWPKTKMFCINLYQKRPARGKLVIQYQY